MASYATVPAADLESEATLLNSKPKTKTSLLVGGVAAAAFVLGVLSMTALRTSPSVRPAAFDANTGRTDPINIILFGSKERAETPNGICLDGSSPVRRKGTAAIRCRYCRSAVEVCKGPLLVRTAGRALRPNQDQSSPTHNPPTPPQRPPRISKLQQIDNLRLNKRTVVKGLRRRRARRAGRRRKQRPVQA